MTIRSFDDIPTSWLVEACYQDTPESHYSHWCITEPDGRWVEDRKLEAFDLWDNGQVLRTESDETLREWAIEQLAGYGVTAATINRRHW